MHFACLVEILWNVITKLIDLREVDEDVLKAVPLVVVTFLRWEVVEPCPAS